MLIPPIPMKKMLLQFRILRAMAIGRAIVSVTFDGQLAVHDIKVINARDRFFIVMPSRKNLDDTYRDVVHPINAQFRGMLEEAVLTAYNAALADAKSDLHEKATETV